MEGVDIIYSVWGNRKGYVFTPCKDRNTDKWDERSFLWPKEKKSIGEWIKQCQTNKLDVYWCPTLFDQPIRKKEYIKAVQCLWADLDEVDPRKLKKKMKPSLAYESSPGRFQCLWYLTKDIEDVHKAEAVNRNISYFLGADPSGWDLTQVLRIPGLRNFKYPKAPKGNLLWNEETSRNLSYFKFVPEQPAYDDEEQGDIEWDDEDDLSLRDIVARNKSKLNAKIMGLLFATEGEVSDEDRSNKLWELECRLAEAGVDVNDIVRLVRLSPWNKFAGRRDEKKRILTEVSKAIAQAAKENFSSDDRRKHSSWTSYLDLMSQPEREAEWLIEGWWQKSSHGMVAGEPKTYKSTFVADFAASVASGEPLYGQFEVHNPGPVIMIQEENSPFLMQDRFRKVANHKGLLKGKVKMFGKNLMVTFPPILPITFLNNYGFDFTEEESRQKLEKKIKEVKPVLIIFDPLYLMLGGKDENSSKELRPLLNWLIYLRYTYNTAIMVVHHWNKSGTSSRGGQRMLGSVTFHGWVESAVYNMVKNEEEHEVSVEREFRSFPKPKNVDIKYTMGEPGDEMYEPEIMDPNPNVKNELLQYIRSCNGATEKEICDAMGFGRTALRARLLDLEQKGLIFKDESKRPLRWFAVKEPEVENEKETDNG